MILVSELGTYFESLPEEFLELLPTVCPHEGCNSPTLISETLTTLCCSNPRCPTKVARRLLAMLQKLGIKGIGESACKRFVDELGLTNPLFVFAYNPDEDGTLTSSTNMDISRKFYNDLQSRNNFTLGEYVRIAQLPDIQSSAIEIFDGYSSLERAYEDIETQGIDFIRRKLGIGKESELDRIVPRVYDELMLIRDMLQKEDEFLEVRNTYSVVFEYLSHFDSFGEALKFTKGLKELAPRQILISGTSVDEEEDLYYIVYHQVADDVELRVLFEKSSAYTFKALSGYGSLKLSEILDSIKANGYQAIRNKLSSEFIGEKISLRAQKVYESLMTFKSDLLDAVEYVNISTPEVKTIKVVCSTSVGNGYASKRDFIADMNNKYKDSIHIQFMDGMSKKIDYLVWSGGSEEADILMGKKEGNVYSLVSNKVKKTIANNLKVEELTAEGTLPKDMHYIPILDAEEFKKELDRITKGEK